MRPKVFWHRHTEILKFFWWMMGVDNCPQLCDAYSQKYDCVRALHKSNGGLSDARNFGIKYARGNDVTFVDGDDFVAPDYWKYLFD